MIDHFKMYHYNVEMALSNSCPKHPFPKEWRLSSSFPIWNEKRTIRTPQTVKPVYLDMIDKTMN